MCGFAVAVGSRPLAAGEMWAMLDVMRHRGPDGAGVAAFDGGVVVSRIEADARDTAGHVLLGHLRLAIIDLSEAGFQPMSDERGDVWVAFNGEIFNFQELRRELVAAGHSFASQTDTEVLVHGWEEWGEGLLQRIEGMFAFGIYDHRTRVTLLARDRLGIKPLYYARRNDGTLLAASEVKALIAGGVDAAVDPAGIDRFLTWLWVPDPETAFEGVQKVPPGHALKIDSEGVTTLWSYWDFRYDVVRRGAVAEAEELREALRRAVSRQLVSDVPLGAFFSGGLDSTAIVELMRRELEPQPPTCFTVGFSERDLAHDIVVDDVRFARFYAERSGIDYREAILEPNLVESLPKVVWHMDEPVADPAALSAFHISRAASEGFTVLLSGAGGDELFGGYPRYRAAEIARRFRQLPAPVRRLARAAAFRLPGAGAGRLPSLGRNAQKLLRGAERAFPEDYLSYLTYFDGPARQALYSSDWAAEVRSSDALERHRHHLADVSDEHWLHQAMYLDLKTFLPSLNLTYMDKMSMAHSIEVRVPLLDELVLDVMRRLPPSAKLDGLEAKARFKQAVRDIVPDEIVDRKKAGFTAPVRGWLAHELRPLVDELLSPSAVRRRGMFEPRAVAQLVEAFRGGRRDTALQIWQLLTLELWQQTFIDARSGSKTASALVA